MHRAISALALADGILWLEGVLGPQAPRVRMPGKVYSWKTADM